MSRAIERTIYFAVGLGFIALAFLPQVYSRIPTTILFAGLSVILIATGLRQLVTAPRIADEVSQKMEHASALRRLGLPASWYTRKILFWQFRILSIAIIIMGFMTAFAAFLAHHRGF